MASMNPGKETIRRCTAQINSTLASNVDLVWFANCLFANSFITEIQQSSVHNTGINNYSKASQLMVSVMSQISITPSKYDEFLGILEEEPALEGLVALLNNTYAEVTGKPHRHPKSVSQKRPTSKQSIKDLELNMKNVTNVLKPVSAWYKLGVQLGVPEYELKQIESNFPKDGDRCKGEVLTYWFHNAEKQSWDVLADAVKNAGHHSLANEIWGVTPEADGKQTTSEPRRRKAPAAHQHSSSSSNVDKTSSVSSSSGTSAKGNGPLLLVLLVVIIGGVAAGVWLLAGSHTDVLTSLHSEPRTDLPPSDSVTNKENKQASTHKLDCHLIEDVRAVRDELRSVTDWKTLGEELQVPRQVLENIDSNNPKAERKIIETIHAWFNIKEKPCWEMVVRALKRMLLKKLANEIAGRHGVNYNEV